MATKVLKYFLGILNDKTFLSSIEYIDFKTRYISIRKDFFNLCFTIANSNSKILLPRSFALILKQLFIHRFSQVSSSNLKLFFEHKISNSFIDYLNIARHYIALLKEDQVDFNKFFRNYLNKRNFSFYEKKGYKYYLYKKYPKQHQQQTNFGPDSNQQQSIEQQQTSSLTDTTELLHSILQDNTFEEDYIEDDDFSSLDNQSLDSFELNKNLQDDEYQLFSDNQLTETFATQTTQSLLDNNYSSNDYSISDPSNELPISYNHPHYTSVVHHMVQTNYQLENSTPTFTGNSSDWETFYSNIESTVSNNNEFINIVVNNRNDAS